MNFRTGVHVSHWDGRPQWGLIKAAGYDFAYVKATEPAPWLKGGYDPDYAYNVEQATIAGFPVGPFHFFRNRVDPMKQADLFLKANYLKTTLPPAVDVEDRTQVPYLENMLIAFCAFVHAEVGMLPLIYTSPSIIQEVIKPRTPLLASYPLWLAKWQNVTPPAPAPWPSFLIWQAGDVYTGNGAVSRIYIERMMVP
jgi:GH25 family lysozyme M1 (1,4-beta-N-acetylmuramidase)